jgi:hypothetical protein
VASKSWRKTSVIVEALGGLGRGELSRLGDGES